MSLEARVQKLEENRVHWDQVLAGVEGTVALVLQEQVVLKREIRKDISALNVRFDKLESRFDKLESRFDKLESRFDKLESRFDQFESRFDQLELLIRQSLPTN